MLTVIQDLFAEKVGVRIVIRGFVTERAYHVAVEQQVRLAGLKGVMSIESQTLLALELEGRKTQIDRLIVNLATLPRSTTITKMDIAWDTYRDRFGSFRVRI
jgi:acylphosphatase